MLVDGHIVRPLKDDIILVSGQHIPAEYCTDQQEGIPYLTGPADFVDGAIRVTKYTNAPQVMCRNGDILLTVKGSGTGTLLRADRDYCISRQLMAIRTQQWNPDYVFHSMNLHSERFGRLAVGLIPGISRDDVLDTRITVPPLEEQGHIATILNTWVCALRIVENLIREKSRFKTGLMQQLLTGKYRFKEFVRSDECRVTRFGSVPKDWRYITVGDIASEVGNRNECGTPTPVLSCTKHRGLVRSFEYFGKQIFSEDTSAYKIVRRGQFAYATNHIEEGSIGLLTELDAGLVSPMYTVFEANNEVHAPFLYALFKTELYRHIFATNTQ